MNRRVFLHGGMVSLAMSGCGGLLRGDVGVPRAEVALDATLKKILEYASLAPSGHNAQPWEVRVYSPRRVSVATVMQRWLPAVDANNREMLLSIGAFAENLSVAASAASLQADIHVVATGPRDAAILDVELHDAPPGNENDLRRLESRKTLRSEFDSKPLGKADLAALAAEAKPLHYIARGEALCQYLDETTIEANRLQAFRDDAQEELIRWVRWSNDEVREHRDGLSLPALEVTGLEGWFARSFMTKASLRSTSSRERAVTTAEKLVRHSGGWLVLGSTDDGIPQLIETGRRFQRLFLRVRERGIGLQPMSQALEEGNLRAQLAARVGVEFPQFLLRIGYVDEYGEPVSVRRPVDWFVVLLEGSG